MTNTKGDAPVQQVNRNVIRALARKLILATNDGSNDIPSAQQAFATFRNAAIVMELLDENLRLRDALTKIIHVGSAADAAGANPVYTKCVLVANIALEEGQLP